MFVIFATCTFVRVSFVCLAPVFLLERLHCCEGSSCHGRYVVLGTAGTDQLHSAVAKTLSSEKCTLCSKCARVVAGLVQCAVRGARSVSSLFLDVPGPYFQA